MRIGELARRAGCSSKAVRFYESAEPATGAFSYADRKSTLHVGRHGAPSGRWCSISRRAIRRTPDSSRKEP